MRHTRLGVLSLALEAVGAAAVLYAVASVSVPLALGAAGALCIAVAQFLDELL